jgi:predicted ArsR family transcriptional regulator
MQSLHPNQKKILEHLLDVPEGATLDELTNILGVTKTAVREHVLKLEHQSLITFTDTKSGVGRPKRIYKLSESGQEAFPRQYSWLSNVLLEILTDDLGPQKFSSIMKDLVKKVAGSMSARFEGKEKAELLQEIKKAMNELGYRAYVKQSDVRKGAVLEASNCVYHSVAKNHPGLCQFDVQFLTSASGMKVKLENCIARGDAICRFCLTKENK